MKWVTYSSTKGGQRVGVLHGEHIHGLAAGTTLLEVLRADALAAAGARALDAPSEIVELSAATVGAPVPRPPSIRDFMAFEEHVVTSMSALGRQVAPVWYEVPVFYFTNPAAVIGPTGTVPIAPGSTQFDYELEAAVVIGRGGGDIPVEDAMAHVAGYTILNDWSARDLQDQEMAVGLGPAKGKDTATSLGPYLVTPDELDPGELSMTAHVNGVEYSRGTLGDLYWSFAQMISYASRGTQLHPGDVIGSGTVGSGCILELSRVHGGEAYPWLRPGDEVRLEIDGLGHQTHQIAAGAPPHPLGAPARTRTEARQ